jgi:glycosyltransferase involved in cell wall biosynthesis
MEAHASGVPVLASTSGAIPEVAGPTAAYFAPGDWEALAELLAQRLNDPPPHEVRDPERVAMYSTGAAAQRLADAYDGLL